MNAKNDRIQKSQKGGSMMNSGSNRPIDPITRDFFWFLRECRKGIPDAPPVMTDEEMELPDFETETIDNDQDCRNNGINL